MARERPSPPKARRVRPSHGIPRSPASGHAAAARTMPGTVPARVSAAVTSRPAVITPSTTIHSASRTTTITANPTHSAAQAQVNHDERAGLTASTTTPEASSTSAAPSPG